MTVNGFTHHYWNGVTCLQLVKIIHYLIKQELLWFGVRHIHSPNTVSKSQIIEYVSEIYNLEIIVNPTFTNVCDKSLTSIYLLDEYNIPCIKDQINELKHFNFA